MNIAIPRAPLDPARVRGFVARLDPVNAAAEAHPGFVGRLQTVEGDATAVRAFDDDRLIVNFSVWESLEDLRAFVYTDRAHAEALRRRRSWFEAMDTHLVLWWIPAGHIPPIAEAEERRALLQRGGPSPQAFTFRAPFTPAAAGF